MIDARVGSRFLALAVAAQVALSLLSCDGSSRPVDVVPTNVLLITLDTTRADRLSSYGHSRITSPNIDALAADGIRFERAMTTAAVTPISHASILTGLNPYQHDVRVFFGPVGHFLTEDHPTLATLLSSKGWTTAAFISAYPASERFGLHWGFETFSSEIDESVLNRQPGLRPPKDGSWVRKPIGRAQRRADHTTDEALAWLDTASQPFFLWLHYFDPHDPSLVPPAAITDQFGAEQGSPSVRSDLYDAEIFFMDSQIGRVLSRLRERGSYDDTMIVIVADHGQGLGDHDWGQHRLLYEEQIRAPLILRLPEGERGLVVPELVRIIDIAPTVLDFLGLEIPPEVEGTSLVPLVEGRPEPGRIGYAEALNTLDAHAPEKLPEHQKDLLFSVVDGDWKLIYHREFPENSELYHLSDDPGELDNVIEDYPKEAKRLMAWLSRSKAMEIELREPEGPIDPDALRKLEALGYLQAGN
ncbi:MAG: sulfatase [Acidobacteriota bacterium]